MKEAFQAREILPNVWHISRKSNAALTKMFLRAQETYENSHFADKTFSWKEYKDWYRANHGRGGKFTYASDIYGFNVPIAFVLRLERFSHLTEDEKLLLQFARAFPARQRIAFIGTSDRLKHEALVHELAHGLYATNLHYRRGVQEALRRVPLAELKKWLASFSYHERVWLDECHAYILSDLDYLWAQGILIKDSMYGAHVRLKELFARYVNTLNMPAFRP